MYESYKMYTFYPTKLEVLRETDYLLYDFKKTTVVTDHWKPECAAADQLIPTVSESPNYTASIPFKASHTNNF